jgi:hypothetical protein
VLSKQQLGARCEEVREAAGISREKMVAILAEEGHSLHPQTMRRWEKAHRDMPAWYVQALTDILGTDPSWLLGRERSPAYAKLDAVRVQLQGILDLLDAPVLSPAAGGVSLEDAERAVDASKGNPPDRRRTASGEDGADT